MRITKVIAEDVAEKLTAKLGDKIKEEYSLLRVLMGEVYEKSLPKGLMDAYKKFPNYFNTSSAVSLVENGANHEYLYFDKSYPCFTYRFTASEEDTKSILGRYDTIQKLEKEKKALEIDIRETLIALKTYNRVGKEFPEAVQYLPESNLCLAVAIPLEDLRGKINKL